MTSTTARMTMKPFGVYLLVITTGLNMLLTGADCAMLAGLVAPIGTYACM